MGEWQWKRRRKVPWGQLWLLPRREAGSRHLTGSMVVAWYCVSMYCVVGSIADIPPSQMDAEQGTVLREHDSAHE
jgi:hypothetical protein